MVEALVTDRKTLAPCAVYLRGEYGIENLFVGVPVLLGKNGVERIIELDLDDSELALLRESAAAVKKGVDDLDTFFNMH
jgi:malate dehydrogenase